MPIDPVPEPILALTGCFFLSPSLVAYQYDNTLTAYLSLLLCLTSIYYHSTRLPIAYWLDQIVLYSVMVRGQIDGYYGGSKGLLIFYSAIGYNYIIYFSPLRHRFAFHPEKIRAALWHSSMHLVCSLGILSQQFALTNSIAPREHGVHLQ